MWGANTQILKPDIVQEWFCCKVSDVCNLKMILDFNIKKKSYFIPNCKPIVELKKRQNFQARMRTFHLNRILLVCSSFVSWSSEKFLILCKHVTSRDGEINMVFKVSCCVCRMYQDKLASLKRQLQQLQEGTLWRVALFFYFQHFSNVIERWGFGKMWAASFTARWLSAVLQS